ncbi:transglycosylase domain-containing protein [Actinoplanes sp. NPDC026670]|uniref:transglycosylase domain-containing protein n=1 Tax=Actinoplanes sp. NPDC026670 TaxID=3154700 RepID=UPI0033FBAABB
MSPGGPSGPGGPGGPGGGGGSGGSSGSGGKKGRSKADKKYRRANILTAAAAVLVIMLGVGIVGGTYFFDDVKLPEAKAEEQMNTFLLSNGSVLERTGSPRINVPYQQMSANMQNAVIAAEDKNFRDHNGIDMKGIARAAWNNFTGGELQGASTITQQYARHVADEKDISYSRKLREAVIARKLESEYSKDEILGMYLNFIDLGRGRYGAESAAQGYYGASVKKGTKNEITVYQAAVLASLIKQPYATKTHPGYDPANNRAEAEQRWEYTLKNMLELGAITQAQYDQRKYPMPIDPKKAAKGTPEDRPVNMVTRHVTYELNALGIDANKLKAGGYTVTTTINPKVQAAAEKAGSKASKTSPMYKQKASYQAAVIGIDPKSGEVLGYYGGDDPYGIDYAGYMKGDGSGVPDDGSGGQSPGSTFKIYTLAAGLKADYSFDTVWDVNKEKPEGGKISNAGADPGAICDGKGAFCDLETATIRSYNFPFYWIADELGPNKVIEAARDAGVETMWTDGGKKIDLKGKLGSEFHTEVAFGQYRVLPLEHAQGVATIVNAGVRHDAHFIKEVKQRDPKTGDEKILYTAPQKGKRVFDEAQMSNLLGVMKEIPKRAENTVSGHESVGKSGTWEIEVNGKSLNGDTWFVGGIPQLAATVWVGGAEGRVSLKEKDGGPMFGSGTPAAIWEEFLETAAEAMKWDEEKFPERIKTGDDSKGNGTKPVVETPIGQDPNSAFCQFDPTNILCQATGNTGNGPGNNGGGNGPGNNGDGDDDD